MTPRRSAGLDVDPQRPRMATIGLFAVVVIAAATFAHLFTAAGEHALHGLSGVTGPVAAARSLSGVEVGLLAAAAVFAAAALGRWCQARWPDRLGVEAVAASARGEDRRISVRGSALRALGTWLMTAAMTSIGREAAIIETSGALGSVLGRKTGGRGDALAAAGIAAGFAAAYHAPLAAVLYLDEHLRVRFSRRGSLFTVAGAAAGHLFSTLVFGSHAVFGSTIDTTTPSVAAGAAVAVVPAVIGARLFLEARVRLGSKTFGPRFARYPLLKIAALAIVAGLSVAIFRDAAGNGMEALRTSSAAATVGLAVALSAGKLVGTTAALASGAPGGALTPTLSVAAGCGLLAGFGLSGLGVAGPDSRSIAIAAMAVGLAVGLRSPLMAIVMVPELVGDYSLIPVIAVIVAVAWLLDRQIDRHLPRGETPLPAGIHDEDG